MASVRIYGDSDVSKSHVALMERLETNTNVKVRNTASAFPTGPFATHRDVYVFAASVALAAGSPTPAEDMPSTSKADLPIKDEIFREAPGADELVTLMAIVADAPIPSSAAATPTDELRARVELIASDDLAERLKLLDRYAHAGFEIIRGNDKGNPRDALLAVLASVDLPSVQEFEPIDIDPVTYFLT